MTPIGPERHVSTADLLCFVDGEGDAAFRERVEAHQAGCAECSATVRQLQEDSAYVLDRLAVLDDYTAADRLPATFAELAQRGGGAARDTERGFGWRRAAVIVLFLGAGIAIARPAAAWLERLIHADETPEAVTAMPPSAEAPALPAATATSAVYSFTPASNELRIDFAAAEPDAELLVHTYDGNAASFEVESTATLPPVLILPNGVRITNGTNRGTQYAITLSRDVEVLIVSIAGGAAHRIAGGSLPARIPLKEAP